MDATCLLAPSARCVRSKMALFLRLWVARHRYEQLRPYGGTSAECLRFHLRQLQGCWDRVIEFQEAIGLDIIQFTPVEEFEAIFVISAYVQRELQSPRNTVIDLAEGWGEYLQALNGLSHEVNPFEFGEVCQLCQRIVRSLNRRIVVDEEPLSLTRRSDDRLEADMAVMR